MEPTSAVSILIAEQHRAVSESLARVLTHFGAEVAAQAQSSDDALQLGIELAPDIAMVDLQLSPNCELVTGLRANSPDTRIIVMADRMVDSEATMLKALEAGAVGAIYKQSSLDELSRAVQQSSRATPVVAEEATGLLLGSYLDALNEKRQRDLSTIEALAAALEVRDMTTGSHVRRVTHLATKCLDKIDSNLGKNEEVSFGFMLHDVGKIGVPDAILSKPGPLSDDEWKVMRKHPEMGVKIVAPLGFSNTDTEIILHHHERWDGRGYPNQLAGEEIPLTARAFSVVDAYDAMTSDRPYRRSMSRTDAHTALLEGAGSQYDPDMVGAVIDLT